MKELICTLYSEIYFESSFAKSMKVRFDQNCFLEYMNKFIFDKNGNLRQVIKEATSITISSDSGKGIVAFHILYICIK